MRGALLALCAAFAFAFVAPALGQKPDDADVLYLPTPPRVVEAMLDLAGLRAGDVLYDLGSGDGRIPIAALSGPGAVSRRTAPSRRGLGVSLPQDPECPRLRPA